MSERPKTVRNGARNSLRQQTTNGFAWLTLQTIVMKLVYSIGQITLGWLLSPNDFGLIGMAFTVTTFTSLLQEAGLREILILRRNRFHIWANSVFWLSLTTGCSAMVSIIALAPIIANIYHDSRLTGLLILFGLSCPIDALGVVPKANLQNQMRFRDLTLIGTCVKTCAILLTLLLAWCGSGAYSLAVPQPISSLLSTVLLWRCAHPKLRRNLQMRRWRYLFSDSLYLLASRLLYNVTVQGDYIVLACFYSAQIVGWYYFAFSFSIQIIGLVGYGFYGVLLPALSGLQHDPAKQKSVFTRTGKIIMVLGAPLCLLQVVLVDSVVRALFQPHWYPVIQLIQILSVAAALKLLLIPSMIMVRTQNRLKTYLIQSVFSALCFLILVITGARYGSATGVALAVLIHAALFGTLGLYIAMQPYGRPWLDVWQIYLRPFSLASLATVAVFLASIPCAHLFGQHWLHMIAVAFISISIYIPAIRLGMPETAMEILTVILSTRRKMPRTAS